jgi:hypothetical protein
VSSVLSIQEWQFTVSWNTPCNLAEPRRDTLEKKASLQALVILVALNKDEEEELRNKDADI